MTHAETRLLSVPELQTALSIARSRSAQHHIATRVTPRTIPSSAQTTTERTPTPASTLPAADHPADMDAAWIMVVAAHHAAGGSTVALSIADAAAAAGGTVRLIDCAPASRSGLSEAATEVLGVDRSGRWSRGRRGGVTIDQPTGTVSAAESSAAAPYPLTIVDAGVAGPDLGTLPRTVAVVVVCQATAPGLRHAESALDRFAVPVVLAVIGPRRWPGVVAASVGPAVTAAKAAGRFVPVPIDTRLSATGLTGDPLPRCVLTAGRAVLDLLPTHTTHIPPLAHRVPSSKENLS